MVTGRVTGGMERLLPFTEEKRPALTLYNGGVVGFKENVVAYTVIQKPINMMNLA